MSGTQHLPMGPKYVDECEAFIRQTFGDHSKLTVRQIIGISWFWAREKGVTGWSKARLAHEDKYIQEPDNPVSEVDQPE